MKTIGSHPGAILFRMSIMVILIGIIVVVFFSYVAKVREYTELASISRTRGLIDSSLAVVFATYAAKSRLNDLNEIDGGNPFVFLMEYKIIPPAYQGVIEHDLRIDTPSGWYYLKHRQRVAYKSRYIETDSYFAIVLDYQDKNHSGRFESGIDDLNSLRFVKTTKI